jgi:predicted Zn finger-like uncharacterized protein
MYTRCPHCDTVFRVTPQQLQVSSGQVRCGRCQTVFDAFSSLSSQPSARESGGPAEGDAKASTRERLAPVADSEAAAPAVRPRRMEPPSVSVDATPASALAERAAPTTDAVAPRALHKQTVTAVAADELLTLPEELFPPGLTTPRRRWLWVGINALLLLGLAAQVTWFFPGQLLRRAPALQPALHALCARLGCEPRLPRVPEQLFIEASDLQLLDAARPSQVLLTATIRNRADFVQAFPLVELTLTRAENQTAARRVFFPREYLDAATQPDRGLGAQQEVSIRLYLDTGELHATGYRLYLFFA